jgi:pimeloyl-ACP methyl ester carboxylesterase
MKAPFTLLVSLLAGTVACVAPLAAQASDSTPRLEMKPCTLPGVHVPAKCGAMEVYENRAAETGRKIRLNVALIPATGRDRAPNAFTFFQGGPGQAAVSSAADLISVFAPILERHDIFLVDQRGTGGSSPLTCYVFGDADSLQRWLGPFLPLDGVRRCRANLEKNADLTAYTTNNHVDDVDDVRAALGYDKIDIAGGSYGTRVALVYLKRHGEHVRSAVLSGIDPTTDFAPETFARDAQTALDGVLDECEHDASCHAAFPHVRDEVRRVVARLERAPVPVQVIHPRTGDVVTISLNRNLFGEAIRYMLYASGSAGWVPAYVHAAAAGNFGPIADRALFGRFVIVGNGDTGLYLSVTCDEDVPFVNVAESERMGRDTFLGNYRLHDQTAACAEWPHVPVDKSFQEPTRSSVPVLLFSGERDPVTPPANGALAAKTLPNSLHIIVKSGGHSLSGLEGSECIDSLMVHFIEQPDPKALDTSCVARIRRRPFPTTLTWTDPVALASAALRRFVGRYVGDPEGPDATIRLEGGKLRILAEGFGQFVLVPVGSSTFRAAGTPLTLTFHSDGKRVTRVAVEQDGVPVLTLKPAAK